MKSLAVFATVGTTSFDDFVESLCSPPFLTAMAHHHHRHWPRRHVAVATGTSSRSVSPPSSSPSKSAPSSSSASSAPARCGSSCSSSLSSSSGPDSSYSSPDGTEGSSLDVTIQYGTGRCPLSFLPPSLLGASVPRTSDDDGGGGDDGSGWTVLSIPTMAGAARDETSIDGRSSHRVLVRWYRFRPTLAAEMERADAILCHAGAGTLLEALEISASSSSSASGGGKKIVNAVINSSLMDNHQSELAEELEERGHILVTRDCASEWTTEAGATKFWEEAGSRELLPFHLGGRSLDDRGRREPDGSEGYVSGFQMMVDRVMGFNESWRRKNS